MSYLNTVDIVLIVLLIAGGIHGALKGFLEEFSQKSGFVIGFLVSLMFSRQLSVFFIKNIGLPHWLSVFICYVVLFLAGYFFIKFIASIFNNIFQSSAATFVNSLLGFFLAEIEVIILACLIIQLLSHQNLINFGNAFSGSLLNSKLLIPVYKVVSSISIAK